LKKKQNSLIYALLVVFTLSVLVGSPAGLLGMDVAYGANASATSNLPTSLTRVLVKGSIGNDVKLLQTLLNNEGFNLAVDGSFGPLTLIAVKDYQSKNGLKVDGFVGPQTRASLMNKTAQKPVESTKPVAAGKTILKVGRADYAAHGTKAFANAAVALAGDKIVAVSIDEYQFMAKASNVGVQNSDADFGKNYANQDMVLGSKLVNAATYSANMATKAGSTVSLDKNFNAIEAFAAGKTVAELEKTLSSNTKEQMVDVVSSATLVDTDGYLKAIVAAAKLAK
jgi:peptidoglycan hydrolase-like protein with peptidoglycan-binding domain